MYSLFVHLAGLGIEVGVACVGVRLGGLLGDWLNTLR